MGRVLRFGLIAVSAVVAVGSLAWLAVQRSPQVVSVQAFETGLLLRGDDIVEVLGPGVHTVPRGDHRVVLYPTGFQQADERARLVTVAGCPADVTIVTRMEDVVAFHRSGGTGYPGSAFATEVQRVAAKRTEFGDDPRTELQVHLNERLSGLTIDGFGLQMLSVSLAGCEPDID
ncbi:MAG: hypothetical protein AAF914_15170 [Pseudomonadota bacterium]